MNYAFGVMAMVRMGKLACAVLLLAGCDGSGFTAISAGDAGQDVWADVGSDGAAQDSTSEDGATDSEQSDSSEPDVTPDVIPDVTMDATEDATMDVDIPDAPPDAPEDVVTGPCPIGRGPAMVQVIAGFCIDATEVTRAQYDEFLAGTPSVVGQPSECAWNTTFAPSQECMDMPQTCHNACAGYPQQCVDWCDAAAFCKWSGKRLCGKIGGGDVDGLDPVAGEWLNVCTSGGLNHYPYGDTFEYGACNTAPTTCQNGVCYPVDVASLSECQTMGVFDMVGNVSEWVNGCGGEQCALHGATYSETSTPTCFWPGTSPRNQQDPSIGFRCCSDPI